MNRNRILAALLSLGLALPAQAAEDKEQKMTSDQTQQHYQRKSITYLGLTVRTATADRAMVGAVERAVRKAVELKRFDYNHVDLGKVFTMDQFIAALRDYVKKRAVDRAAAEAEYEARFKQARVYMKDIERIMNSAYFYRIRINDMAVHWSRCGSKQNVVDAILSGRCVPGSYVLAVRLDVSVVFYRANLLDESKPPYKLVKEIRAADESSIDLLDVVVSNGGQFSELGKLVRTILKTRKIFASYVKKKGLLSGLLGGGGKRADVDEIPDDIISAVREYARLVLELNRAVSSNPAYRARSDSLVVRNAIPSMLPGISALLTKQTKQIPDFKLKVPVQAALSDGVEFMLGKNEGVRMDDTYEVTEYDTSGKKSLIGYVKVRKIGDAKATGEGTPSYAEKVKEKRRFVGGEQLFEHPMIGISIGASFMFEFAVSDVLGQDGVGLYPGGAVYVDYDLAPVINVPEFYFSTEADFLYIPTTDLPGYGVFLIHAMAGVKKKWYAESLIFTVGLRGGLSYYQVETDFGSYEDNNIGFGADGYVGIEYYIIPEFQLFSKFGGRFFTNPLQLQADLDPEMGGFVQLGVIGAF